MKKIFLISILTLAILYFVYYVANILHLGFSHYVNILVNLLIPITLISYVLYKWNDKES